MESQLSIDVNCGISELLRLTCAPRDGEDQVTSGNLAHVLSQVLLSPPDDGFLAMMAHQRPLPGLRLSSRALVNELSVLAGGASLPTYQAEFQRLFLSGERAPCHPCESAWRKGSGPVGGTICQDVRTAYQGASFGPTGPEGEPEDHVGVEMAFLEHINAGIIEGAESEQTYWNFWERHIAPWVPSFADCLRRSARIRFYRTVGQLLLALTVPDEI